MHCHCTALPNWRVECKPSELQVSLCAVHKMLFPKETGAQEKKRPTVFLRFHDKNAGSRRFTETNRSHEAWSSILGARDVHLKTAETKTPALVSTPRNPMFESNRCCVLRENPEISAPNGSFERLNLSNGSIYLLQCRNGRKLGYSRK